MAIWNLIRKKQIVQCTNEIRNRKTIKTRDKQNFKQTNKKGEEKILLISEIRLEDYRYIQ